MLARRARRRKRGAFLKVRFQGREKAKRARLGEALEDRASRRRPVSKEGDKLAMAGSKDLELSVGTDNVAEGTAGRQVCKETVVTIHDNGRDSKALDMV